MPEYMDSDQMILRGMHNSAMQVFNKIAGMPSGPQAESAFISPAAHMMSSSEKSKSASWKGEDILDGEKSGWLISSELGSLNTDVNWSCSMSAIFFLSVTICLFSHRWNGSVIYSCAIIL